MGKISNRLTEVLQINVSTPELTDLSPKELRDGLTATKKVIAEYRGERKQYPFRKYDTQCAFCVIGDPMRINCVKCPLVITTSLGCGGNFISGGNPAAPPPYWNRQISERRKYKAGFTARADYLYEHVQKPYEAELTTRLVL